MRDGKNGTIRQMPWDILRTQFHRFLVILSDLFQNNCCPKLVCAYSTNESLQKTLVDTTHPRVNDIRQHD